MTGWCNTVLEKWDDVPFPSACVQAKCNAEDSDDCKSNLFKYCEEQKKLSSVNNQDGQSENDKSESAPITIKNAMETLFGNLLTFQKKLFFENQLEVTAWEEILF